jgi:DNA polymerase I-like protein with 3'-5' exonuclease and polymerase domains
MAQQRDRATGKLSFPDLTPDDVRRWHNNWHTLHPETKAWHEACAHFCDEYGYSGVPALDMRKRFFHGGVSKKNAVPNMMIQGFAGSIANRALLLLAEAIPFRSWSPWTGLILQVHDYIAVQAPEHKAELARNLLEKCMHFEYGGVQFPAEAGVSKRWSGQD